MNYCPDKSTKERPTVMFYCENDNYSCSLADFIKARDCPMCVMQRKLKALEISSLEFSIPYITAQMQHVSLVCYKEQFQNMKLASH
jgi:hypothetical protein